MSTTSMEQVAHAKIYFYNSPLIPVYTLFCVLGSFPFLLITFSLGLSVASDVVFGVLVALGGPLGDVFFRKIFKRDMYLVGNIQAMTLWPVVGLYVMIFRPFES